MNPRISISLVACLLTASLVGCNRPLRPEQIAAKNQANALPGAWTDLDKSSSYVRTLPVGLRTELTDLQSQMIRERQSQYFAFYGRFTPETQARIDALNRACNEAYLVSDRRIGTNLTPDVKSVSDTESELWWSNQEIYDIQSRELVDDWRVLWLMDSPSTLNRQPIIDLATP